MNFKRPINSFLFCSAFWYYVLSLGRLLFNAFNIIMTGSSFPQEPRRLSQVDAVQWLGRLQVWAGHRSHSSKQATHTTSTESGVSAGRRSVVLLWTPWSIPMVVVTTNTLGMPVLSAVMHLPARRLVSLLQGGLVVCVGKLLQLHPKLRRVLNRWFSCHIIIIGPSSFVVGSDFLFFFLVVVT